MARVKGQLDPKVAAFRKRAVELKLSGRSSLVAIELAAQENGIEMEDNWKKYSPSYISGWAKAVGVESIVIRTTEIEDCLLYTSPSPRD